MFGFMKPLATIVTVEKRHCFFIRKLQPYFAVPFLLNVNLNLSAFFISATVLLNTHAGVLPYDYGVRTTPLNPTAMIYERITAMNRKNIGSLF